MTASGDYVKLHFIVFLWGFTAILGKLISIPTVEMVFYRTLIAATALGLLLLIKKDSLYIKPSTISTLILTGFIVSFHWITFFGAARLSNVSVSLVGFATASLWTAILEPLSNRQKIKGYEIMLGLVVISGIIVIFSFDFKYRVGFLVGMLSGLLAAVFSIINARFIKRTDAYTITFYEMLGATIGIALFFPFYKIFFATNNVLHLAPTSLDWIYIIILALVCTVYAFTVMVELMKRVSVFFIQLTINLEPIYGIIMALLIFKDEEKMSWKFYLGTLIILSAVLAYPYLKRKFDRSITLDS
jgi:drug/metabolite transporter (DMT)-like permease